MDHHMLGVITTIWLLLQLPVALALGRFIACAQKPRAATCADARRTPIPPRARAA
jgi:sorbitol-specific phosphotransferase system component IIC